MCFLSQVHFLYMCVCVCLWFRISSCRRQGNVCGRLFAGTETNTVFGKSGVKLALEIINTKGTICSLILFIFSMHFRNFLFNKLLVVAHYRQQKSNKPICATAHSLTAKVLKGPVIFGRTLLHHKSKAKCALHFRLYESPALSMGMSQTTGNEELKLC